VERGDTSPLVAAPDRARAGARAVFVDLTTPRIARPLAEAIGTGRRDAEVVVLEAIYVGVAAARHRARQTPIAIAGGDEARIVQDAVGVDLATVR
jgi:hypothetical protein